jgi:hypothetical protein
MSTRQLKFGRQLSRGRRLRGGGDQGADPNKLVDVTDNLSATNLPTTESAQNS